MGQILSTSQVPSVLDVISLAKSDRPFLISKSLNQVFMNIYMYNITPNKSQKMN